MIMCIRYFGSNNAYSHNFHIDEVNNTTFKTPISLRPLKKCPKLIIKNHFYFKFHSIRITFDTYMIVCIKHLGSNNVSFS